MRNARWIVVVIAALLVGARAAPDLGLGGGSSSAGGGRDASGEARVVRVVDGDTILVARDGGTDRVRYIGIDTPETVKPGTPVQCFGHRASAENDRLVSGRAVRLVVGEEPRDRYGRLLAYVYRAADGRFVNEELVRDGYARTLTIPPNDRYAGRFAALQDAAREAGRGLWGAC
jgi:micrococcal nuclease